VGVLVAVPPRVERRVAQPEVGPQVDDRPDPAEQLGHDLLGGAVGQTEEHEVEPVAALDVVLLERELAVPAGQARVQVGDPAARLGVSGGDTHVEVGMGGAQAQ
jgi:hypothetical protein